MALPDFLIIGAAKCGTTSIFQYMAQHPHIYVSKPKEPAFFAYEGTTIAFGGPGDERYNKVVVTDFAQYTTLFDGATVGQKKGEASVVYLYHPAAPERIHRYVPAAKMIVILRDPVDRAISAYMHQIREGHESLSFEEALDAELSRISAGWQHLWHYRSEGLYAQQLLRYFKRFPRNQFLIIRYEDLKADLAGTIRRIFEFIEVDANFSPDTSFKSNKSGVVRSRLLHRMLFDRSKSRETYQRVIPEPARLWLRANISRPLQQWNLTDAKPEINPNTLTDLRRFFQSDIIQLQELLNDDFSAWLSELPDQATLRDPIQTP